MKSLGRILSTATELACHSSSNIFYTRNFPCSHRTLAQPLFGVMLDSQCRPMPSLFIHAWPFPIPVKSSAIGASNVVCFDKKKPKFAQIVPLEQKLTMLVMHCCSCNKYRGRLKTERGEIYLVPDQWLIPWQSSWRLCPKIWISSRQAQLFTFHANLLSCKQLRS